VAQRVSQIQVRLTAAQTPGSRMYQRTRGWDLSRAMDATYMNYVEADLGEGVALVAWARERRAPRRRRFPSLRLRFA
jgi:hypothetical protein